MEQELFPAPPTRKPWDERLARIISDVGGPPVLTLLALGLIAIYVDDPLTWLWLLLVLAIGMLLPLSYIIWLVRTGRVTDFDLSDRRQRTGPYLVSLTCVIAAWLVLWLGQAPTLLIVLVGAQILQTLLMLVITLVWKISIHGATSAAVATLAWSLVGLSALPLGLSVPVIAWSRVRLKRHTPMQTIAGAVVGCLGMLLSLRLAGL